MTEEKVFKELQRMKNSKNLSLDTLQADLFKLTKKHTVKAIHHITNMSIETRKDVENWNAIPILKFGEDHLSPKRYRPVSLPVLLKD